MVHVYVIRANADGIEIQDGTYRIFRKKRTSETALAGDGDMGELSSQLTGKASLLKPNIGCSGESKGVLQEVTSCTEGWLDKSDPQSHRPWRSLTLTFSVSPTAAHFDAVKEGSKLMGHKQRNTARLSFHANS